MGFSARKNCAIIRKSTPCTFFKRNRISRFFCRSNPGLKPELNYFPSTEMYFRCGF